jgi:filamentous hemagglutinin family protein
MTQRKLVLHPLRSMLRTGLTRTAAGVIGAATPLLALANPSGGQVVAGGATIKNAGNNGMVINQTTQRAIIDWQQFSVGKNQYVQFVQPNSSSVVLNRIIGGAPSQILGDIRANGQVFLVNPNGIFFAPGASLDAQGVVASSLDISDSNFMASHYVFSKDAGANDAGVDNQGQIRVGRGGYVVLQGDYSQNQGNINAQFGQVYLAAGGATTLTLGGQGLISYTVDGATLSRLAGVKNSGEITATGGMVVMTADVANALTATAVNNTGLIAARSVRDHGGEIVLEAEGGGIYNSGHLDASAAQANVAGGTVILHGTGMTELAPATLIDVSGEGAKGGFIDLSGSGLHVRGMITTGKGGNLLLDPSKINIVAGNASGAGAAATNSVGTGFIASKLNAGSNVEIVASNTIKNVGTNHITATGNGNLTIETGHVSTCPTGICVGGTASVSHGTGSIDLTGLPITIGGNLAIDAAFAFDAGGHITTGNLKANSVNLTATTVTVNGTITATGGDVAINAHSDSPVITVTGAITAAGAFRASFSNEGGQGIGSINLKNVTAEGITIKASKIKVVGNLHATGSGEAGSSRRDVSLVSQQPFSTGGASISVTGNIISDHGGVSLTANGRSSAANIGNITVGGNVSAGRDVLISASGQQANEGNISVTGGISAGQTVTITALGHQTGGGNITIGGAISAGGDVRISASNAGGFHNSLKTGAISASGVGASVTVNYAGGGASGAGTTVKLGNVDAQRQIGLNINDSSNAGSLLVKTGILTNHKGSAGGSNGDGIRISLTGPNPHFQAAGLAALGKSGSSCECAAGDINVQMNTTTGSNAQLKITGTGTIKSTHGDVNLGASGGSIGSVAVNDVSGKNVSIRGRSIAFGNITAASDVSINDNGNAHSGVNITAAAGTTITARFIDIDLDASYGGNITLSNLAASSSKAAAGIDIKAQASQGVTHILVNGNITVSGKANVHSFSSAMPGDGTPLVASLDMQATGSATAANSIKIRGLTTVTAHAGAFNLHHVGCSGECGGNNGPTIQANGIGGAATMTISAEGSHGLVSMGAVTMKGPMAEMVVRARQAITVGNISVTASGQTASLNVSNGAGDSYASNMSNFGRATVELGGAHSNSAAAAINTGNINISGKGSAALTAEGTVITAGNVTVTATAATVARRVTIPNPSSSNAFRNFGVGENVPGLFGLQMETGTFTAGRATVFMGASFGSIDSRPDPAQTIKVGNVAVTGVGEADIGLVAHAITAGSINVTAATGKMKGTFSSGGEAGHFHHTFNIVGGEANIDLEGGSASNTTIIVNGGIAATGPTAGVNMFGTTIKVTKGIAVSGKGGQATLSSSGTGGGGFTHDFKGPGPLTGITVGGEGSHNAASINIGGTVSAKGKGVIGIAITGAKVALGGLSASASTVATYKIVDSSDNVSETFTAGSVGVVVFQEAGGAITGPATINGDVNLSAPHGNVNIGSQLNVTGQVNVTAAGNITDDVRALVIRIGDISDVTNHGGSSGGSPGIPSTGVPLKLTGAGISMIATGGSIDLTGATIKSTGVTALKAGDNIVLSGVDINVGTFVAYAGSTIHNGGATGTITANAVAFHAGKDLTLSSTDVSVGSGIVPLDATTVNGNAALKAMLADTAFAATLSGDPALTAGLAAGGISPNSPAPNATFIAGGAVSLGGLTMKGGYLYLQGASVSLGSAVTAPKGLVVQVAPSTVTGTTDLEGKGASGANMNLNDTGFLDQFGDGITIVLGASGQSGAISLGNNGTFDIGSDNLILDTSGTVTGLGNVISTGIVSSLESLLGSAVPPPTASEIDPNSVTTNNPSDRKHHDQGGDAGANGTTGGGITQDTSGSSACH